MPYLLFEPATSYITSHFLSSHFLSPPECSDSYRSNSKAVVGLQFYPFKHPQAQEEQAAGGGWTDDMCKTRIEPGQYMSITQDGKLSYWTENLKHMYTLMVSGVHRTVIDKYD